MDSYPNLGSRFDDYDDDGDAGGGQHDTDGDAFLDFLNMLRPLHAHVVDAVDSVERDIELAVIAKPGHYTRGEVGHASVAVLLPGQQHPVVIGFYPAEDADLISGNVPGNISDEGPGLVFAEGSGSWGRTPSTRIS